MTVLVEF